MPNPWDKEVPVQVESNPPKSPGVLGVNVLYLIVVILLVTVGMAMQLTALNWGLIGTEFLVILLPALIYLKLMHLPVRETLRLRWPSLRLGILSLVIGAGMWLVGVWLESAMAFVLGYSVGVPPEFFPTTLPNAVVLFIALAVSAPIGEEILFRGIIQRGYECHGAWVGVVAGGILFAFYHMRFQGLLPLFPVAFALGYVVWRSNSLVTGMLVHFAVNALAGGYLILAGFRPDLVPDITWFPLTIGGVILATCGFVLFHRSTPPVATPVLAPPRLGCVPLVLRAIPLFVSALVYVFLALSEVIAFGKPDLLAYVPLDAQPAPWPSPVLWQYQIRNVLDQPIGQGECALKPADTEVLFDCALQHRAFEARTGLSYFNLPAREQQASVSWRRDNLQLVRATLSQKGDGQTLTMTLSPTSRGTRMSVSPAGDKREELDLPPDALLIDEWPWRLSTLPFSVGYVRRVALAYPLRWRSEIPGSGPEIRASYLLVIGAEPLATPAGNFITWHVMLGDHQSAWYDIQEPHTLVRYDDGVLTLILKPKD
jgi:membrane protease YdiL (CAAX protease family)